MLKSLGVAVLLASAVAPAPVALADAPLYQCVVRAVEGGSWTGDAFEGYAFGYAAHAADPSLTLTCEVKVNGGTRASVSGRTAAGSEAVAHGRVLFTATPSDYVEVVARLTSSHGTQERSVRYFPYDEQPVRLPAGQDYDCALDAVQPGGPAGDNFEGVARGYVTRARGGAVTVRCYVRVDGSEQQFSSTPTGTGTGAATTSGRVTYRVQPWSTVEIVAEVTTPDGTFSSARVHDGPETPHLPDGVDVFPYDQQCGLHAVRERVVVTGSFYEGIASGYVTDSNADVSIRCFVRVNGWEASSTPTGTGRDVAVTQGSVRFPRGDADDVYVCAEAASSEGGTRVECVETTTTRVPPQEVVDAVSQFGELVHSMDGTLCPFLASLAGGPWQPLDIDWEGDVYLNGRRVHDCPPYDSGEYDSPVPVVDVLVG